MLGQPESAGIAGRESKAEACSEPEDSARFRARRLVTRLATRSVGGPPQWQTDVTGRQMTLLVFAQQNVSGSVHLLAQRSQWPEHCPSHAIDPQHT